MSRKNLFLSLFIPIVSFILLVLIPSALADSIEDTKDNVDDEDNVDNVNTDHVNKDNIKAGIPPDNAILWRIETFLEDINVVITYDSEEKIAKTLRHAAERIAETEKMLRWKKTSAAEKSKNKHEALLENVEGYISKLDYKDKQKELEKEYKISKLLENYDEQAKRLTETIETNMELDEQQQAIAQQMIDRINTAKDNFGAIIDEKKKNTKIMIKAKGISDSELEEIESAIKEKLNGINGETKEEAEVIEEITEEKTEDVPISSQQETDESNETEQIIGEQIQEATATTETELEENKEEDKNTKNLKSRVKVEGNVTAEQLQMITLIYEELRAEKTSAEIEIILSQTENGMWKVEKEVNGVLSETQEEQVALLVDSLMKNTNPVRIKIIYAVEDEDDGVG